MKEFSQKSLDLLKTVHPDLIRLFMKVNEEFQCTILTSTRTVEEEQVMIDKGLSRTMNSMHLVQKDGYGHAVDVAPDPVDFERKNFMLDQIFFAGYVLRIAHELDINLRYGGDWNKNHEVSDETFQDLDHFEIPIFG